MKMREYKQLILHIGAPKTGTSALQDFFYFNAQRLTEIGVHYLRYPSLTAGQMGCSGNGWRLLQWCQSNPNVDDPEVLLSYFSGQKKAICSHEEFFNLPLSSWELLGQICDNNQVIICVIAHIRSVYETYFSTYVHRVKMHGETRDFLQFAGHTNAWQLDALKSALKVFPNQIRLIPYDKRSNSAQEFFDAAGIDLGCASCEHPMRAVNRGLTSQELRVLVELNRVLGDKYSVSASEMLITANPEIIIEETAVDLRVVDIISKRHGDDLLWLNDEFYVGRQGISIIDESVGARRDELSPSNNVHEFFSKACNSVEQLLFRWVVCELAKVDRLLEDTTKSNIQIAIGNALNRAAKSQYANSLELPPDFNVCGYLLRNVDVLFSKIDPYEHYIRYGKAEKRVWSLGRS